jgi:GTP-binding protein Era
LTQDPFRAGYVAIVGRPNVGKSTLLNRLVGEKISITSRKPQTTRSRITGIVTRDDMQLVFVDTPGFQTRHKTALNRSMNRVISQSLAAVDVVVFVVEAVRFDAEELQLLSQLPQAVPVVLVINKIDQLDVRSRLLPFMQEMAALHDFAEIVPVSATKGEAIEELVRALRGYLPEQPALHNADEITESSERFLAAELIREKLFRQLGDELPYASTVIIERFEHEGGLRRIEASIIVDKESHKGMVIGKGGSRLKEIGTKARVDMEKLFGGKVHLQVWVKVKSGWADNAGWLRQLGHG